MKRYKLIILVLALCLLVTLNNTGTLAYLINQASTEAVSFNLGNIKVETDNTLQNSWRYAPVPVLNKSNDINDLIDTTKLSSDLAFNNIRPGDAFEKDIVVTSLGSLDTKLKIVKGNSLIDSPFNLSFKLKDKGENVKVTQDSNNKDIWYFENLKSNDKVVFTIRLEVSTKICNQDLNDSNIKLSNDVLELLDITATQWNNAAWSE